MIYFLLIAGTVIFVTPFLWMISTSMKGDRELFMGKVRFLPRSPNPRLKSPYIDELTFEEISGKPHPHQKTILKELAGLVRGVGFQKIPDFLDQEVACRQIARGIYTKLSSQLPKEVWEGDVAQIVNATREIVDRKMVENFFSRIRRQLCLGQIRVGSVDLVEEELGAGLPSRMRMKNLTPDVLTLNDDQEKGKSFAALTYDFSKGDKAVLTQTFNLGFNVDKLKNIQVSIRPDDTWHELQLTVEKLGKRYVSRRSLVLCDYEWRKGAIWQEPGPDDYSTKIKKWILLDEAEQSSDFVSDPHKLKLTLEFKKSSKLRAWWNKLRWNFDERLRWYIPFWRYVRVSPS